jgi:SNF2 family N-terminal domain
MTSKSPVRCAEDVDELVLSYAELKAIASGNPQIIEKMQLDADVNKLKLQKSEHLSQRYMLEDKLLKEYPKKIKRFEEEILKYEEDIKTAEESTQPNESSFSPMLIDGKIYTEKADAGSAILDICAHKTNPTPQVIGTYRGFIMEIYYDTDFRLYNILLRGKKDYKTSLGTDVIGNITRLNNRIKNIKIERNEFIDKLNNFHRQEENARAEISKPFPYEEELEAKFLRLSELNAELNLDKTENITSADEPDLEDEDMSDHIKSSRRENVYACR